MPEPIRQPTTTPPARPRRMRRLIPLEPPRTSGTVAAASPALAGIWLGLAAGFSEVAVRQGARALSGQVTVATLATNHHHAWMTPLADLCLIGGAGLVLGLVDRVAGRPGVGRACRVILALLAAHAVALAVPGLHKLAGLALAAGAGWRLSCWIESDPARFRLMALGGGTALGLILLGLAGQGAATLWGGEARALAALPAARPGSPNVLWVVLDTVRADALSPARIGRDTTPHLARLAARGVRFERAQSPSPWTLPAHASLFTGRWAHEHSANVGHALDRSDPTVAEILRDRGYATAAFVANTHNGNSWYGLDRGFGHYEDLYENRAVSAFEVLRSSALGWKLLKSRTARKVLAPVVGTPDLAYRKTAAMVGRDLLAWLPTRGDRPFLAFLNLYDAHDPYTPPPDAPRAFAEAGARANPPRTLLEVARDDYDDCLRSLDDEFGRLLEALDDRGLLANTLVVVTSDHGEAFGEHGLQGHGISLYGPELHVPLIVAHPNLVPAGRVVAEPVSTRDVGRTILDLVGAGPDVAFPGSSLQALWSDAPGVGAPVLATVSRAVKLSKLATNAPARRGPMFSLIEGGRKLLRNGDGRDELYDLRADPGEARDLAGSAESGADLERLRARLGSLLGTSGG